MSAPPNILKIGNAQGFWGDDPTAPLRLVEQQPDLNVLTLDYLAEVSMSILAKQRDKDPATGYARDFLDVVRDLAPLWQSGRRLKLVTNAGGLNPAACAAAAAEILRKANVRGLKIGVITGDDVLPELKKSPATPTFNNLESARPLSDIADRLVTANAYIGAEHAIEALNKDADIIITGRVADPSLTVAPAAAYFGWEKTDFNRLAGATIAGHLIECGTQVTGGISSHWLDITAGDDRPIGFPVIEIDANAACVITKPPNTGGRVDERTVKEQLVYELGDPARYLSPDVTVNFLTLTVTDQGHNRVAVSNATGSSPPSTYKVSATYRAGYRSAGTLLVGGADAPEKARRASQRLLDSLTADNQKPAHHLIEIIGAPARQTDGAGASCRERVERCHPGAATDAQAPLVPQCALRIAVADDRREVCETFSRRLMSLVTSGPQGITGYADGRPPVRESFGYWPCLIDRSKLNLRVEIIEI